MELTASNLLGGTYGLAAIATSLLGVLIGVVFLFTSLAAGLGILAASGLLFLAGLLSFSTIRGLIERAGLTISGGAAGILVAIITVVSVVLFTVSVGGGLLAAGSANNTGPTTPAADTTGQPTISGPPQTLLPTIDDFDADWVGGRSEGSDNEAVFINTQTEAAVTFRVTLYDSAATSSSNLSERRESVHNRGYATESVDVGAEGFLYKPGQDIVYVHFRQQNVVGTVEFYGNAAVLTPESNTMEFARLLEDTITR